MTELNVDYYRCAQIEFASQFVNSSDDIHEDRVDGVVYAIDTSLSDVKGNAEEETLQALRFMRLRTPLDIKHEICDLVDRALGKLEVSRDSNNASESFLKKAKDQNKMFLEEVLPGRGEPTLLGLGSVFKPDREKLHAARVAFADSTLLDRYPELPMSNFKQQLSARAAALKFSALTKMSGLTMEQINPGAEGSAFDHE